MSRIIGHIPNTITSCNLLSGVLGVIAAFGGHFQTAFILMLLAALFDFCDGLAARALNAYSEIGKELDSLSDTVSFGVLPSVMMFNLMASVHGNGCIWCYVPLVLAVFSALRLAKFNVDERQHDSFIGLATPPSAMICASLCCFAACEPESALASLTSGKLLLPILSVVLSLLLVSEIPMFAMKFGKGKSADRQTWVKRIIFLASFVVAALVVVLAGLHWSLIVLAGFLAYLLINLIAAVCPDKP